VLTGEELQVLVIQTQIMQFQNS